MIFTNAIVVLCNDENDNDNDDGDNYGETIKTTIQLTELVILSKNKCFS